MSRMNTEHSFYDDRHNCWRFLGAPDSDFFFKLTSHKNKSTSKYIIIMIFIPDVNRDVSSFTKCYDSVHVMFSS